MANLFQRKAAGGREMGGNNFDPLQSSLAQSGARVNERTLVPADGVGQPRSLLPSWKTWRKRRSQHATSSSAR